VIPQVMNTVKILMRSLVVTATPIDDDFRAPAARKVLGAEVELWGQVNYGRTERIGRDTSGNVQESDGHLVFAAQHLTDMAFAPKVGDKITSIAERAVSYKVLEAREQAHLNGAGNTVHIFFAGDSEETIRNVR